MKTSIPKTMDVPLSQIENIPSLVHLMDSRDLVSALKDTERLNFLLERPCRMPIQSTDGYVVQEWIGHTTGRGAAPREAIDAAMAASKKDGNP